MTNPIQRYFEMIDIATPWSVVVARRLGLADVLADGPRTLPEIAAAVGAKPGPLRSVLRLLASRGMFTEATPDLFANNEVSALLRTGAIFDAEGGIISEVQFQSFSELVRTVQTGESAFEHIFGCTFFEFLSGDPERRVAFDNSMRRRAPLLYPPVVDVLDLEGIRTVVDVGAGPGTLLTMLLAKAPHVRGILFDLPEVIAGLSAEITHDERITTVAGDFFDEVPRGGDLYVLGNVLHDWPDDRAVAILRRCREAMGPGARMAVLEAVIPVGDVSHPGKEADLTMLVFFGARERTGDDWVQLLRGGGFRLDEIVPTEGAMSILWATPTD